MRFKYNEPKSLMEWHKKFAWLPRKIDDVFVWLEFYDRKIVRYEWHGLIYQTIIWEYRLRN